LKHEKLDAEIKAAESQLDSFIRSQFSKTTEAAGLGKLGCEYFSVRDVNQYTRARLAVRSWQSRKSELAAKYLAARSERIQATC
jgi:hypothetical protein